MYPKKISLCYNFARFKTISKQNHITITISFNQILIIFTSPKITTKNQIKKKKMFPSIKLKQSEIDYAAITMSAVDEEIISIDGYNLDRKLKPDESGKSSKPNAEERPKKRPADSEMTTTSNHYLSRSASRPMGRSTQQNRRSSAISRTTTGQAPMYQPTYRLDSINPLTFNKLNYTLRQTIVKSIANRALYKYRPKQMLNFCQHLAIEINLALKLQRFDRYRFIVLVTVVERKNPSICSRMGFVWDTERDMYASFTYHTQTYILNGCAIGVYWE